MLLHIDDLVRNLDNILSATLQFSTDRIDKLMPQGLQDSAAFPHSVAVYRYPAGRYIALHGFRKGAPHEVV